jgi:hypothetical protein
LPIITAPEEGIVHLEGSVASGKVNRDGLVVPEELAVPKLEMIDRKSEELLDGGLAFDGADFSGREIGGAIGIESYVDHGLVEDDFVESEFGTEERTDLQASDDAVHVGERNVSGGLTAVDGDIADGSLEAEGCGVNAADFDTAAGDALYLSNEAAANQRLKRFSVDVDEKAGSAQEGSRDRDQQIFPPMAAGGLDGGFGAGHCD